MKRKLTFIFILISITLFVLGCDGQKKHTHDWEPYPQVVHWLRKKHKNNKKHSFPLSKKKANSIIKQKLGKKYKEKYKKFKIVKYKKKENENIVIIFAGNKDIRFIATPDGSIKMKR